MHSVSALILVASTKIWSGVPATFTAGQPAKAQDVNSNFAYLDSAVAKKANRTSLDSVGALLKAKADTASLASVKSSLNSNIGSKADTSALTPIKTDLSSLKTQVSKVRGDDWILGRISDTAKVLRGQIASGAKEYPTSYLVQGPNDFINDAPWYGIGLSNLPSGDNYLVQLGGYYGLNLISGGGYPIQFYSSNDHKIADFAYDHISFFTSPSGTPVQVALVDESGLTVAGDVVVSGSVKAKALTQVPDYVFESGYDLAPLSEVEAYTKEHKHLPEVPSASEIESNGVDLAQMNLILLRKIEELTLHSIQQQKRLDAQEHTIEDLKAFVEALKVR